MPKRNGEMAAASSFVWPSVVVYRGDTVVNDRSDNFGALLEKLGHVLYVLCMTSYPFIMIFILLFSFLSLPTDPKFLRR